MVMIAEVETYNTSKAASLTSYEPCFGRTGKFAQEVCHCLHRFNAVMNIRFWRQKVLIDCITTGHSSAHQK
eukprot:2386259-Amphidinium_carterae.1